MPTGKSYTSGVCTLITTVILPYQYNFRQFHGQIILLIFNYQSSAILLKLYLRPNQSTFIEKNGHFRKNFKCFQIFFVALNFTRIQEKVFESYKNVILQNTFFKFNLIFNLFSTNFLALQTHVLAFQALLRTSKSLKSLPLRHYESGHGRLTHKITLAKAQKIKSPFYNTNPKKQGKTNRKKENGERGSRNPLKKKS